MSGNIYNLPMIYFSEIKGKRVVTKSGKYLGRLRDLIFIASHTPEITKMQVKINGATRTISTRHILGYTNCLIINDDFTETVLENEELYLGINLLDKQIIDIKGNKVVRVNDVVIRNEGQTWFVAGVDIGILGVLRWFGMEAAVIKLLRALAIKVPKHFLPWATIQPLELSKGKVVLRKEQSKLEQIRPEDLADYLEETTVENIDRVLTVLDDEFAADVIANLNPSFQTALFNIFESKKAAKILTLIDPDEAVDILLTFSEHKRQRLLELLPPDKREELEYLLKLSKTPIGELVTSEFITVSPEDTVKKAIDKVRRESIDFYSLSCLYVVNEKKQLVGVISLHELLLHPENTPLYRFMVQNIIVAHLTTPEELVIKKMLKYKLYSLPVVDHDRKILGVINMDDVGEFLLEEL